MSNPEHGDSSGATGALDRVRQLWAAAAVTLETDRLTGVTRQDADIPEVTCVEWLDAQAHHAAKGIPPGEHPIDPFITAELARWDKLKRPRPGQWWTDKDRVADSNVVWAVVKGLGWVRKGGRPTEAARLASTFDRDMAQHHRDQVVTRIYHLCRMAGLEVV